MKYHLLRFISLRNASLTIVNILAPHLFMLVYKVETVKSFVCDWGDILFSFDCYQANLHFLDGMSRI